MTRKDKIKKWASLTILGFYLLSLFSILTLIVPVRVLAADFFLTPDKWKVANFEYNGTSINAKLSEATLIFKESTSGSQAARKIREFTLDYRDAEAKGLKCAKEGGDAGLSTTTQNRIMFDEAKKIYTGVFINSTTTSNVADCSYQVTTSAITVQDPSQQSTSLMKWQNINTLEAIANFGGSINRGQTFTRDGTSNNFFRNKTSAAVNDNPNKCQDVAVVKDGKVTVYELTDNEEGPKASQIGLASFLNTIRSGLGNCDVGWINGEKIDSVQEGNTLGRAQIALADPVDEAGKKASELNPSTSGDEVGDTCETTDSGPLGWILCPVIELGVSFSGAVFDNFVRPFLEDTPVSASENDPAYTAWKSFRLIGNIVLVGTMLAVVYAQVKG